MLLKRFTFLILILSIFSIVFNANAQNGRSALSSGGPEVTPDEFYAYLKEKTPKVIELDYIRKTAEKMGIHVWLFGGTAAGFAHYIKWDLQRQKGDQRFQKDRFDYDFTNIFRSNQDLDIVIDGNVHQAEELERLLSSKFGHVQGDKSAWEVRLLNDDRGDKVALLDNPDFSDQHTDSHSTGLIEITNSAGPVVRDLRDWKSDKPFFLKDVLEGKLHFYFSNKHETTKFYQQGRNPPIIAAIRYLTKAVQYELILRQEDMVKIKDIITAFNVDEARNNSYVNHWIEKNGKKLIQNAVNIEYAWNLIEELGLRTKLIALHGDVKTIDSLAWWLNREPLRSFEVGKGPRLDETSRESSHFHGKTVAEISKELGLSELVVAHGTDSFSAYESITRAHTGDANVLTSRIRDGYEEVIGETAAYGAGFYTQIGDHGAKGSLNIRFTVDPRAVEGIDFTAHTADGGYYMVFKNKRALRVIPESLNLSLLDYFKTISNGDVQQHSQALYVKLKRRLSNLALVTSAEETVEIKKILEGELLKDEPRIELFREWFSVALSVKDIKFTQKVITTLESKRPGSGYSTWSEVASKIGVWTKSSSPIIKWAIAKYGEKVLSTNFRDFFDDPAFKDDDHLLDLSVQKTDDVTKYNICAGYKKRVFSYGFGPARTLYLEQWLESRVNTITSLTDLNKGQEQELVWIMYILGRSNWADNEKHLWDGRLDLVEKVSHFVANREENSEELLWDYAHLILARSDFVSKEGVEIVLKQNSEKLNNLFLREVAFQNRYLPLRLWDKFDARKYGESINEGFIHAGAEIKNHPEYMESLFDKLLKTDEKMGDEVADVIESSLWGRSNWLDAPHYVRMLMSHHRNRAVMKILTSDGVWLKHPDLYRDFFENLDVKALFDYRDNTNHPNRNADPRALMNLILKAAGASPEVMDIFMKKKDPYLQKMIEETLTDTFHDSYSNHSYYQGEDVEDAQALMFRYLLNYHPYKPEILVKLRDYSKYGYYNAKDFPLAKYPFILEEAVKVYMELNRQRSPWAKSHYLILQGLFRARAGGIPELVHLCGGSPSIEGVMAALSEGKSLYLYQSYKKFKPETPVASAMALQSCENLLRELSGSKPLSIRVQK